MRNTLALGVLMAWALGSEISSAAMVRVIHTNDLHSHLDHAADPNRGGYQNVARVIRQLRAEAAAEDLTTLALDGGDFLEGSAFYLAENGRYAMEAFNQLEIDAAVLGNHDHVMGALGLDFIFGRTPPRPKIVAANFSVPNEFRNLRQSLTPYTIIVRDGISFGILGLTSAEQFYKWHAAPAEISGVIKTARETLKVLRPQVDFVIAVTHIGVDADVELAEKTEGIDLIVGGHSHTTLTEPKYAKNLSGKKVPIVQAGEHGNYVGSLLVDFTPGLPALIINSQLVPVENTHEECHPELAKIQANAEAALEKQFGKDLNQPILTLPEGLLASHQQTSFWGQVIVDAMKKFSNADFAVSFPEFSGMNQPNPVITRRNILEGYPRLFDLKDSNGWNIYTLTIRGSSIRLVFNLFKKMGFRPDLSGIQFLEPGKGSKKGKILIGGKAMKPTKLYKVAVPEGIARGLQNVPGGVWYIMRNIRPEPAPMWRILEQSLKDIAKSQQSGT